jgi:hypothetical protein
MLKQQMANKINDIMQNGYQSPTEKDRDGNPKVYTGQEAIDKFMEFAQAELAEKAKDAQMASWKNWDAAEAAKAAKEAAQAQAFLNGDITLYWPQLIKQFLSIIFPDSHGNKSGIDIPIVL